eukprot:scaffold88044_cov75-Phaeocystis_antarctica.AAC.2
MPISTLILMMMKPTIAAASASAAGNPSSTPPLPMAAATEVMASERWCFALAMRIADRRFSPAAEVILYRASLLAIAMRATTKGHGPIACCVRTNELAARVVTPFHKHAHPALARTQAITAVHTRSNTGALTASMHTPSTTRSLQLWPASATSDAEPASRPTASLRTESTTFEAAPSSAMFCGLSSDSPAWTRALPPG